MLSPSTGRRLSERSRSLAAELLESRVLLSAPYIDDVEYVWQSAPQQYKITFDQEVNVQSTELLFENLSTPVAGDELFHALMTWNSQAHRASWTLSGGGPGGGLADGNYRAMLDDTSRIVNGQDEALLDEHRYDDLFVWSGDADHDRDVDLNDLGILSTYYGTASGATFAMGDFDADGDVDMADLGILSGKYGTSLAAPPASDDYISVSALSDSEMLVSWTDDPNLTETSYRIRISTDGIDYLENDFYTVSDGQQNSVVIDGLEDGTKYWFKLRRFADEGNTGYTFANSAVTVLPAPSGISATAVCDTQVDLTWTDNSDNEGSFEIQRKTGSGGTWATIHTAAANVGSFTDYTVVGGTQYYYRVQAMNGAASSAFSTEKDITTPPAAPSGLTLTGSTSGILLDWSDNTESSLSGYNVYRSSSPDGTYTKLNTPGLLTSSTYDDTAAPANANSYYRVTAVASVGGESVGPDTSTGTDGTGSGYRPPAYTIPGSGGVVYEWRATTNPTEQTYYGVTVTSWTPGPLQPSTVINNNGYALTLGNLPIHSGVVAWIDGLASNADPLPDEDQVSLTVAGQAFSRNTPRPPSTMSCPLGTSQIAHTDDTLTVSFGGSGFESQDLWSVTEINVMLLAPPTVNISKVQDGSENPDPAEPNPENEDPKPVIFRVSRSGGLGGNSSSLEVFLDDPSGTAEKDQDYNGFPNSVTIPANEDHVDFELSVVDDGDIEPHEKLIANLRPDPNNIYALGNAQAQAQIFDNDVLIILISGHGEGDPNDPMRPAPGAGIWGLRDELIGRGFHPDNIEMLAEDAGGLLVPDLSLTNVITTMAVGIANAGDRPLGVAMVGHSHGGGLIYEVSQELAEKYQFWVGKYDFSFAGYIDAIDRPGPWAETHRPVSVGYHMNYYQSIPNADVFAGTFIAAADVNHDFDAVQDTETHTSIDHEQVVHDDFADAINTRLG